MSGTIIFQKEKMNIKTIIALAAFMLLSLIPLRAQRVMVVNIDEEIDATAWRHLRGALRDAETAEPPYNLLMVHLNTYGGAVDMADSMRTALMRCPLPTVAFVDHNAASAGALIVLACDSAYMAPGSSIGAATVVNGQGEPMPPKYQSYWSSVMRSTAAAHGSYVAEGDSVERWRRDPDVAAEMVNPERAVSFTTEEAVANGIVDGTATSVRGVLEQLDMSEATITEYTPTFTDRMMGFFASAGVRVILIMLILGGLYMEMHTPGLGFAAAVSVVATVLYFLPMIVTGTLAPWVVILFLIGVVALALEIFVIPGFGIAGVIGIVAIVVALLGAMVHTDSLTGIDFPSVWSALGTLCVGSALAIGAVLWLTSKHGPKRFRKVATLTTEISVKDGFVGVDMAPSALVGKTGTSITPLRPSGKVEIEGNTYDATSTGEFINSRRPVKVVRYEAAQIYVEINTEKNEHRNA